MDLHAKIRAMDKIAGSVIDINRVEDRLNRWDDAGKNRPQISKQIFFSFSIPAGQEGSIKGHFLEQLQIAFQILINQGYTIVVFPTEEKDAEACKSFADIFKDQAIQYAGGHESLSALDLLCTSEFAMVMDEECLVYALILNKPFMALSDNGELLEGLRLPDLFINREGFNAGVLLKKVNYLEMNAAKIKDAILRIFVASDETGELTTEGNAGNEMELYKKQFKDNIQGLIEQGLLQEAGEMLDEYEKIVRDDIDIYSIKGIIAMMEGNMDGAVQAFEAGLKADAENYDLFYNLAYLYQINSQIELAITYYKKAFQTARDENNADGIYEILQSLGVSETKQELKGHIMPKTSIIILTYNNLEYNKHCIESIRKYTQSGSYEIIVVDNHSTDGTAEWLNRQSDLKLILNGENLGFPKGCNQGIEAAEKGNDILLLNNDTVVTPNWLSNLNKCLYSDPEIGAVGPVTNNCSYYQAIEVTYKNVDEMIAFAGKYNASDHHKWEQRVKLIGFCMLIKRKVLDQTGLLDERFSPGNFEDDDLSFRIQEAGFKLMLCKDTFIHHFGSMGFRKNPEEYAGLLERNARKFKEKWGFHSAYSTFIRNEIIDLMDKPKDEKINVLEVGCACGATLLKIKDLYKQAGLYGIELEDAPARIARNFADVRAEDIEKANLTYDEGYFDYIIFADVLEHLYDPWKVLENIKKYLKPDGAILASIPNVMHYTIIRDLLQGNWTYKDAGILDRTHIRFFTFNEINRMFMLGGYSTNISGIALNASQEDIAFLDKLSQCLGEDKKQQYSVYQYLVKAHVLSRTQPVGNNKGQENQSPHDYKTRIGLPF